MRALAGWMLLATCALTTGAHAEPTRPRAPVGELPKLQWDDAWVRFQPAHAAVTLAFGALGGAATLIHPLRSTRREGGILFDDDVRGALRADTIGGRFLARDSSDALLSLLITYPYFVDALATAWWYRSSADVARQMTLINVEAMAITAGVQGLTNVVASRERPYGADCGGEVASDTADCSSARRYRSFFSGHSAQAFTAASLICSHHMKLRLFGPGAADAITCITALATAGTVATLRVVGDMHYASDVTLGAGVGLLVGFGVPFLHYHRTLPTLELGGGAHMSLVPTGNGVSLSGSF